MTRRAWTTEETAFLRDHYGKVHVEEIAKALGRTKGSTVAAAGRLALKGMGRSLLGPDWTEADVAHLRTTYGKVPLSVIARDLNRTQRAVKQKAARLRIRGRQRMRPHRHGNQMGCTCAESSRCWSLADVAFLETNYGRLTPAEIGKKVKRSKEAVRQKANALGLTYQDAFLSTYDVADIFGVSWYRVSGWLRDGLIAHRLWRRGGKGPTRAVDEDDLIRFIEQHPDAYDTKTMPESAYLDFAIRAKRAAQEVRDDTAA